MIELGKRLSLEFHKGFVGRKRYVLWERPVGGSDRGIDWIGYTDNYIRVKTTSRADQFNKIRPTWLDVPGAGGMVGRIEEPVPTAG